MVELVTNNSETDIAKHRALGQVQGALVQLTSNLLRVTRGAGKGYEIAHQALDLVKAFTAYQEAAGHLPSDYDLSRMLDLEATRPTWDSEIPYEQRAVQYAEGRIARGVLQLVAQA